MTWSPYKIDFFSGLTEICGKSVPVGLRKTLPRVAVDFSLHPVFVTVFRKNSTSGRYRYDYHKGLACVIMGVGKSQIC